MRYADSPHIGAGCQPGAAIDVLIHENAIHQFARKPLQIPHDVAAGDLGVAGRRASADGDEQQIVFARRPVEPIGRLRGHAVEQEGRVVVRCDAAIHEYADILGLLFI